MNKFLFTFCLVAFGFHFGISQVRTQTNFGDNWEFRRDDQPINSWQKINLPHTTRIENLIVKDQFQGESFYRKKFKAQVNSNENLFLYFEGIMIEADVFLNGKKIANHTGGYLPFTVDITNDVIPQKENSIEIKVVNKDNKEVPPGKPLNELDFSYYGGIYRNAYLIKTQKLHITDAVFANKKASGGIFVNYNKVQNQQADGTIKVHIQNNFNKDKNTRIVLTYTDSEGKKQIFKSGIVKINANSDKEITQNVSIKNPKLWNLDAPNLYQLKVQIFTDNKLADEKTIKTGIRTSEIREDGYYLNGKKIFITGTNRHQEFPYLGYAVSDEAQYRDAVKIKSAGLDFVRLSHYPQSEAFLNACDELGILVMNSIAGWQFFGNENFQNHAYQDLRDMVRRDRNHPSVIFWENSLNESEMSDSFIVKMNDVLNEEIPYSKISAGWMDHSAYNLFIPARQHAKAPDYWNNYDKGNRKIFIAEYGDWEYYAQNAGFNQKDFANLKEEERTSRQLRAFGEKRLLQQAFNFQQAANSNKRGKNTIGEANWLMFDYNRGYSPDIESSGISDIFRIPKFAYYFYQSQRDASEILNSKVVSGPVLKIASYYNEKSPLDIRVYSNCDEVELYLNGKLISRNKPEINNDSDMLKHPPFIFSLSKFEPGTLKAIGYIKGIKKAEDIVKTPKKASKIELSCDISNVMINKTTPDVLFIYAKITDENGTIIPDYDGEITFGLEGKNAELIGENPIKAEAGIATILLRTSSFRAPIKITAKANNLLTSNIILK